MSVPDPSRDLGTVLGSPRIAIIMPVYNEGSTIEATISEIRDKILKTTPSSSLLIFEDGSEDNTKDVLGELASQDETLKIQTSPERKGYPRAVRDALASVSEKDFDYVLFMDSDGQYDPDDFEDMMRIVRKNPGVDIVMGRRLNRAEPFYRVVLSSGLKAIEILLFNPPCRDMTSAFRLIKTEAAKTLAEKVRYSRYNFWLEFTARAAEERYAIEEVPVKYRRRKGDSNVYSMKKMPRVVYNELGAVVRTWWEYRWKEASNFAAVGLTGAMVILGLTYLLVALLNLDVLVSAAIAIEVSIIWAFVLNDRLTFGRNDRPKPWYARLARYNLLSLGGLLINESVLFGLTAEFRTYYLMAEFMAIVVAFAFNYFTNIRWTWVRMPGRGPAHLARSRAVGSEIVHRDRKGGHRVPIGSAGRTVSARSKAYRMCSCPVCV